MKRIFVFLLFVIMSNVCLADAPSNDWCHKPNEYTVDKRCYVTDEQIHQKPYNAVVGILGKYSIECSGTIVEKDGKLFLYTAKHCADLDYDNKPNETIKIKLQDGRELNVKAIGFGNYDIESNMNVFGDWAVFNIEDENLPYVHISTNSAKESQARLIGHGTLKIMSDVEIYDFKSRYINYLKRNGANPKGIEHRYSFDVTGGIRIDEGNDYILGFLVTLPKDYYFDLLDDTYLKESYCKHNSFGAYKGCQFWGGNSGGGKFDSDGNLMSIHTRGTPFIGGKYHADAGHGFLYGSFTQINLPNKQIDKITDNVKAEK